MMSLRALPLEKSSARRVWVVESDDALRAALTFSLKARGFSVKAYPAGSAAAGADEPCDCLVIDFFLPDMDGLDLLNALRCAGNKAPAILVVSNPSFRVVERANAMQASIIQKPLLGDDLCSAVRSAVN